MTSILDNRIYYKCMQRHGKKKKKKNAGHFFI